MKKNARKEEITRVAYQKSWILCARARKEPREKYKKLMRVFLVIFYNVWHHDLSHVNLIIEPKLRAIRVRGHDAAHHFLIIARLHQNLNFPQDERCFFRSHVGRRRQLYQTKLP